MENIHNHLEMILDPFVHLPLVDEKTHQTSSKLLGFFQSHKEALKQEKNSVSSFFEKIYLTLDAEKRNAFLSLLSHQEILFFLASSPLLFGKLLQQFHQQKNVG